MAKGVRCPNGHGGSDVATVKEAALRGYHPAPAWGRGTDPREWNRLYYCYTCALPFAVERSRTARGRDRDLDS
jgi:hypothetical protein